MTSRDIIRLTAAAYDVPVEKVLSTRRLLHIVRPRHVAMFLCRSELSMSFPEIGRAFGGRDHTTVMAACRSIAQLIREDAEEREIVDRIRRAFSPSDHVDPPACLECARRDQRIAELKARIARINLMTRGAA